MWYMHLYTNIFLSIILYKLYKSIESEVDYVSKLYVVLLFEGI